MILHNSTFWYVTHRMPTKPFKFFKSIDEHERLALAFVLVVSATALLLHALTSPIDRYGPDGRTYEADGWKVAQADGIFACDNFWHAYRPPGWIAVVAVIYRAGGREPSLIRVFLVACAIATACLIYRMASCITRPVGAVVASALYLFSTLTFRFTTYYQYELVLAMAVSASVWWMLGPGSTDGWRMVVRAGAAGTAFGWAALISSRVLVLAPLVATCALADRKGRLRWSRVAALSVGLLMVLVPWTIRNYRCFGEWIPTTSNGGINLYIAHNPHATGGYYLPPEGERPAYELFDSADWTREALSYMRAHPGQTARRAIISGLRFWKPHFADQLLVWTLFFIAVVVWFRRGHVLLSPLHACILAIPLVMTVVHMAFFVLDRYQIPVLPFVCAIAGAGIGGWKTEPGDGKPAISALLIRCLVVNLLSSGVLCSPPQSWRHFGDGEQEPSPPTRLALHRRRQLPAAISAEIQTLRPRE